MPKESLRALLDNHRSTTAPAKLRRLPPGQFANNPAAMLEQLEIAKSSSAGIESRLKSLRGTAKATKARAERQTHQRDWLRTHADLQRQRVESEAARAIWLQSESEASNAEALPQLRQLAREDEQAAAARREWSVEMRSQLQGLRELCQASVAARREASKDRTIAAAAGPAAVAAVATAQQQPEVAAQMLSELSRSLSTQAGRLAGAAEQLERELAAHTLAIMAPDEPSGGGFGSFGGDEAGGGGGGELLGGGDGVEELEALAGSFIRPMGERSEKASSGCSRLLVRGSAQKRRRTARRSRR